MPSVWQIDILDLTWLRLAIVLVTMLQLLWIA